MEIDVRGGKRAKVMSTPSGSKGKRCGEVRERIDPGERSNRNITPRLHLKLWRRIMYERCESEVNVRRDGGASHVGDGDVVIIKVFERGTRTRRGTGARVATTDARVLGDHSSGTRRRNRTRLRRR